MNITSVIRNRGQLTIPEQIRRAIPWLSPMSAVEITVIKPDEILIRPQQSRIKEDYLWELIRKARSHKGVDAISGSESIRQDRDSR